MAVVEIEVANTSGQAGIQLAAELEWLGETRHLALVDDGSVAGDNPNDNVFVGRMEGQSVRLLPVQIFATVGGGKPTQVGAGVEPLDGLDAQLVYELSTTAGQLHAERVPAPWVGQPRPGNETERVWINGAWIFLTLVIVGWLARARA